MKRVTVVLVMLPIAACASAPLNERGPTEEHVRVADAGGAAMADVTIERDDYVQRAMIDSPREDVWRLLPAVYEEVGLPAPGVNAATWTVAVQNHTIMRRVGRDRMSRLIDCGRGMTSDHADTHRIRLSVRTWLTEAGAATRVNTRVEAVATSVDRAGSITCTSRGPLELRIVEALRSRVEGR